MSRPGYARQSVLSNAEKRAAVNRFLDQPGSATLTAREVAMRLCVSDTFVRNVRRSRVEGVTWKQLAG